VERLVVVTDVEVEVERLVVVIDVDVETVWVVDVETV